MQRKWTVLSILDMDFSSPQVWAARFTSFQVFEASYRFLAVLAIFLVSLFAISFPCLAKRLKGLRIPHLVFFMGKHFGTGVILSTAFCHLLPDAFESLQSDNVNRVYHGIRKWAGPIILCSLLTIFLVEYISTSYVDYLYAETSLPSSPATSSEVPFLSEQEAFSPIANKSRRTSRTSSVTSVSPVLSSTEVTDATPLLGTAQVRHKSQSSCELGSCQRQLRPAFPLVFLNSPRLSRGGLPLSGMVWGRDMPCACRFQPADAEDRDDIVDTDNSRSTSVMYLSEVRTGEDAKMRVGRKRQITGILVLQVGIMIHSLVIGSTLAITSGSDFMSLLTAVLFHQLFEGLSLGIRIAGIPALPSDKAPRQSYDLETSTDGNQGKLRRNWLSPTLSFLFAVTTPFGMTFGLLVLNRFSDPSHIPGQTSLMLIQGLMSGISAGMLIYAATVEMLAGDFVFSDVGGEHGHVHGSHHHHHHDHDAQHVVDECDPHTPPSNSLSKRVLAVMSLLTGSATMAMVGS